MSRRVPSRATPPTSPSQDEEGSPVGLEVEVDVGPVAHGGHCVARHAGRVLFVRHALPGERVRVRVTEGGARDRFWRADAVEVLVPSVDRVPPPCPWSGPGRCGGCDFQHVDPRAQRRLKATVVAEQLTRLAGLALVPDDVLVEEVGVGPGDGVGDAADAAALASGLRWRTRVTYAVGPSGRAGLHAHRSSRVVEIDDCRIASAGVRQVAATTERWPGVVSVEVIAPAGGPDRLAVVDPALLGPARRRPVLPGLPGALSLAVVADDGSLHRVRGRTWVAQDVDLPGGHRSFRVTGGGFWQVHAGAPAALTAAVLAAARPAPGERALDLYSGVGLFTAALALSVGESGSVVAVESDARACADARRNLRDLPQVRIVAGRVDAVLRSDELLTGGSGAEGGAPERADPYPADRDRAAAVPRSDGAAGPGSVDVVVLDPPRAGARRRVVEAVTARRPRVVVYVACDPASLARDVAVFAEHGYVLDGLRAFDLFPQTHHVECVARLVPVAPAP